MKFLVTIKLPHNPKHDPRNKQTGKCPVWGVLCTDTTGAHHTGIVETENINKIHTMFSHTNHITRIEEYSE